MGNKASAEKNGSRGHKMTPSRLQVSDSFREVEEGVDCGSMQYMQHEDQNRTSPRQQTEWEREEAQRKAQEIQELHLQLLELNTRYVQEQERRHEEQTLRDIRRSLPRVCRHYNSRHGCNYPNCRGLHLCRLFLADICTYGSTCRYSHSLTTEHNQAVCSAHDVDTSDEFLLLQQLRQVFEDSEDQEENMFIGNLTRCYKFRSRNPCLEDCHRIHICRQFVVGGCERRGANCRFGHDLHTAHNQEVLRRHRLANRSDEDILSLLREKEERSRARQSNRAADPTANRPPDANPTANRRTAVASSARNGAIPRTRPSDSGGDGSAPQPSAPPLSPPREELTEELQCPVCLEMFNRATTLGCGHTFCAGCLQEVRDRSGDKCPLCRADITSAVRSVTLDNVIRSMATRQ